MGKEYSCNRENLLFLFLKFILLFIFLLAALGPYCCVRAFLQLRRAGATLRCGARASHCGGFSCCGAQALGVWASVVVARGLSSCGLVGSRAQAHQLWRTDLVAPRHVGSSRTRARTRVPCIGRQILNHCTTKEAAERILNRENLACPGSFRDRR